MTVLVTYASKHGATQAIAEHIAKSLAAAGREAEVRPVAAVRGLSGYDAVVIGSATYMAHWRKEATQFVERNRAVLADKPVWLFSSGPLGTKSTDEQGRDLRETAEPKEIPGFADAIAPRGHHVFFGALDPHKLTIAERSLRKLPAGKAIMPEGDFRDWAEVETWAHGIARALAAGQQ